MEKKAAQSAVVVLFLLNLLMGGCAATGTARPPAAEKIPGMKADCSLCHPLGDGGGGALRKPISELCRECHPARTVPSEHKIDVVPSVIVPELPLKNGKMTCTTCHDPHSNTYPRMLRVPGKNLCALCHKY